MKKEKGEELIGKILMGVFNSFFKFAKRLRRQKQWWDDPKEKDID